MPLASLALPVVVQAALLLIPLCHLAVALLPTGAARTGEARRWRVAGVATPAALVLSFALVPPVGLAGDRIVPILLPWPSALSALPSPGLRLDGLTVAMLVLVNLVGVVVVRFSHRQLGSDPGGSRYLRWLGATLASVTSFVIADNLVHLALAWIATSLSLHQLLTFHSQRPRAILAAHEKFIVSRAADLCLIAAFGWIGWTFGTFEMSGIFARVGATSVVPAGLDACAVLLVVGAALKCAQLPFHGWLIRVMEAPTPVSALLHAGIVNMGGFLLIRLAPLIDMSAPARDLLVLIGCASAVLATLVALTQVSVKSTLAWSTCAQMGFMLVECGLGAYDLALLHIVGHSLYKAHAFLSSGSRVERWRLQSGSAGSVRDPASPRMLVAIAIGLPPIAGILLIAGQARGLPEGSILWLAFACAAAALWIGSPGRQRARPASIGLATATLAVSYVGWHALFGMLVSAADTTVDGVWFRTSLVALSFAALPLLAGHLGGRPRSTLARLLQAQLHAGLHLDQLFTRITFRLWPPHLPMQSAALAGPNPWRHP